MNRFLRALGIKLAVTALVIGGIFFVGYLASDKTEYPGKAEFAVVNDRLTVKGDTPVHGDSPETLSAAANFSAGMKKMQAMMFSGGSGKSFASGGEFLTYVVQKPGVVIVLCHVPELRNYKSAETRESLASLAWSMAQVATTGLPGVTKETKLMVGLRGFGSYGPIWEGKMDGEAVVKTDELDEVRRFYPHFVVAEAAPAAK